MRRRCRIGVELFNFAAIARFDVATTQLEGGRQGALRDARFLCGEQEFLELLELGEALIELFDDAGIERLDLGIGDQLRARRPADSGLPSPLLQRCKSRKYDHGDEAAAISDENG